MTTQTTTQTSQNADSQYTEDMDIVVVSPDLNRDSMSDTEYARQCQQLEDCYTALETDTRYSVQVRPARAGEAPGTYYRTASGGLQILGYSLEMPEDLRNLSDAAWEKFCNLPNAAGLQMISNQAETYAKTMLPIIDALNANSLHDALLRAMSGATTWRTP